MPTRRTVLLGLFAPTVSFALPAAPTDGLFLGKEGPEKPISYKGAWLHPQDNANSRYTLEMQVERFGSGNTAFLRKGSLLLRSGSYGGDTQRWTVSFEVDRPTAELLSDWLGVPLRERVLLGSGLRGTFSVVSGTVIRVELTHTGTDPVGVILGGRQRGPRDNQFHFQVQRDGVVLPELEGYDFGGLSTVQLLAPGQSLQREADASLWVRFDAPGLYRLSCRYEATLVPSGEFPEYPHRSHEHWDAAWEGTVELQR